MGAISSENCKLILNPEKEIDVTLMLIDMSTINQALIEQKEKEIDGILGGDILNEIKINKVSVNFYVKGKDTLQQDTIILEKAMDMSHIKDKEDYSSHINVKLPQLHN